MRANILIGISAYSGMIHLNTCLSLIALSNGSWWFVVNNEETGGVTQIIFPKDFSGVMLK